MYACFDQPDLKATFELAVTAPADWRSCPTRRRSRRRQRRASATARRRAGGSRRRRSCPPTSPRSWPGRTTWSATSTTASRSACTAASRWPSTWTPTRSSRSPGRASTSSTALRHPYPFGKYDQLFVPEFNAGAMENAGCVTFLEDYVFRSRVTDAACERRAETILHEMAHMWFGDLVTMRWWDDLWLNESFADLGRHARRRPRRPGGRPPGRRSPTLTRPGPTGRTSCPPPTRSPPTSSTSRRSRSTSTASPTPRAPRCSSSWSPASGQEEFLAGVRQLLRARTPGATPTLADLLAALEETSGRDLDALVGASGWRPPGSTRCGRRSTLDDDGAVHLVRGGAGGAAEPPDAALAPGRDRPVRPDRRRPGPPAAGRAGRRRRRARGARAGRRSRARTWCWSTTTTSRTPRSGWTSSRCARWSESIGEFTDSLPRALCWSAAWDMIPRRARWRPATTSSS